MNEKFQATPENKNNRAQIQHIRRRDGCLYLQCFTSDLLLHVFGRIQPVLKRSVQMSHDSLNQSVQSFTNVKPYLLILHITECDAEVIFLQKIEMFADFVEQNLTFIALLWREKC